MPQHECEKMIAFEKACDIARGKFADNWKITAILETPHYWIFYDNSAGIMPIGYRSVGG